MIEPVQRKTRYFYRKLTAIFLSVSLLYSEPLSFATSIPLKPNKISTGISIPGAIGEIEEGFQGTSGKTLIYIQDAHDSLEAQENIARAIDYFVEHDGVKTVYEEGFEGPVPTDKYFGPVKNPEVKRKLSYFFLDKLRIGGAEYAHINRERDFKLVGADSIKLHFENISAYKEAAKRKTRITQDFGKMRQELDDYAKQHYPPELKEWMKLKIRLDENKLDLLSYIKRTRDSLLKKERPEDLAFRYPSIDLLISAQDGKNSELLKKAQLLDPKEIFKEIDAFENNLAARYLETKTEQKVFAYYKGLETLRRLSEIQIAPDDFQSVSYWLKELKTDAVLEFIAQVSKKPVMMTKRWETSIKEAVRFYDVAHERDKMIESSLQKFINDPKENTAVLVYGGFHKSRIEQMLKRKNISCYVVTPRITSVSFKHQAYYKQLMSVGYFPFEMPAFVKKAAPAKRLLELAESGQWPASITQSAIKLAGLRLDQQDADVILSDRLIESAWHDAFAGSRSELRSKPVLDEAAALIAMDEVISSDRSLIFSENSDAIDSLLIKMARTNQKPYLRLTLRDQTDLDRLMITVSLKDGEISTKDGRLADLILNGGILMIDYNGSDPKLVEGFNSLFDPKPYFGRFLASDQLKIVGVMSDKQFNNYPVSFYSRFQTESEIEAAFQDPVRTDRAPPEDFKGLEVRLYQAPKVRADLIGHYFLGPDGRIVAEEGILVKALKTNQPLLILGGAWKDSDLSHILRQALLNGHVDFNGERIPVPENFGEMIFAAEEKFEDGIQNKTLVLPNESKQEEEFWVINRDNQDILFNYTQITPAGQLTQQPGLLEKEKLRIRVTDFLPDWVWHRIFHAKGQIEIEIMPGITVPSIYDNFRSEALKKAKFERKIKPWNEVENEKVIVVEGEDASFVQAKIGNEFSGQTVLVYPVTPQTGLDHLIASIEIDSEEGKRVFVSKGKGLIQALRQGHAVILEGLDANETLIRQLETVMSESPYLLENGVRISLRDLPGKLILSLKPQKKIPVQALNYAEVSPNDEEISKLLSEEFRGRFNEQDYQKILKLRKIFESIPAPSVPGLYPSRFQLSLSRLRLLYRFDDWYEAFENVVISHYVESPETAAFMRTMVRLIFDIEETGRQKNTIHGKKLTRTLNGAVQPVRWETLSWQFADTLSLDLLKQAQPGDSFVAPKAEKVFRMIQEALIKNSSGERKEFYRHKFKLKGDFNQAADIDSKTQVGEMTWQEQKEKAINALLMSRAAMFKGPPGTGKSYVTDEIGRELGYASSEVIGPITVGVDVRESDIISRRVYEEGKTREQDEAVAQWAKLKNGGLLIVDEANLAKSNFWNFLRGLFAPEPYVWINGQKHGLTARHRVIFTGNQEHLSGRNFLDLVQESMVTVYFPHFGENFLKERAREYLASNKSRREDLVKLAVEIHGLFDEVGSAKGFSLRDLQEFSARINVFLGADWSIEEVVSIAWRQYQGIFSPEERLALQHLLSKKYGILVAEDEQRRIEEFQREKKKTYFESGRIQLVDSAARMAVSIFDFLDMREARLKGKTRLQGKRGMIFEGPSGRGKDVLLLRVLKDAGFVDAKEAGDSTPAVRKFYHLNASLDYDRMVEIIRKAQAEGSVVIVSEMNLLPTALLEGKLNDVLTGKAIEGFAFFGTINSMDFSGREKLSTALQNRIVYQQINDYSQTELLQLVGINAKLTQEDIAMIVNLHAWIRQKAGTPNRQPTTRELLKAVELMKKGKSWRDAANQVYGPVFLKRVLSGQNIPEDKEVLSFKEAKAVDNVKVLEHIAGFIIPRARGPVMMRIDASNPKDAGGYYSESDNSLTIRAAAFENNTWEYVLFHEASHGRFTRDFDKLTPDSNDPLDAVYQDLEDLRHGHAFRHHFSASAVDPPSSHESRFAGIVAELDIDALFKWMSQKENALSLREIFQYSLIAYVKGLLVREHIDAFAQIVDGILPVNSFETSLKYLDTAKNYAGAIPLSLDEDEIQFQQYRALELLQSIRDDYAAIPEKFEDIPAPSEGEQQTYAERALNKFTEAEIKPGKSESAAGVKPGKIPTQEEINAKKLEAQQRRRQLLEATRQDIERELDAMDRDLSDPQQLSADRLTEITELLTSGKHPYSFVPKIRQLNDDGIHKRVSQILDRVKQVEEILRRQKLRPYSSPDFPPYYGSAAHSSGGGDYGSGGSAGLGGGRGGYGGGRYGGSGGSGGSYGGSKIGRRYPDAAAHKAKEAKQTPKEIKPAGLRAYGMNLSSREQATRNSVLQRADEALRAILAKAVESFFQKKLEPEKIYGREGTLDVERFVTGDPTTAFIRSGGSEEKKNKTLVLVNPLKLDEQQKIYDKRSPSITELNELKLWATLADQLLFYLFSQGFQITAYAGGTYSPSQYGRPVEPVADVFYQDGITTLFDLKHFFVKATAYKHAPAVWLRIKSIIDIPSDKLEKDLRARGIHDYEILNLEELARRVETEYLAWLLQETMGKMESAIDDAALKRLSKVKWLWDMKNGTYVGLSPQSDGSDKFSPEVAFFRSEGEGILRFNKEPSDENLETVHRLMGSRLSTSPDIFPVNTWQVGREFNLVGPGKNFKVLVRGEMLHEVFNNDKQIVPDVKEVRGHNVMKGIMGFQNVGDGNYLAYYYPPEESEDIIRKDLIALFKVSGETISVAEVFTGDDAAQQVRVHGIQNFSAPVLQKIPIEENRDIRLFPPFKDGDESQLWVVNVTYREVIRAVPPDPFGNRDELKKILYEVIGKMDRSSEDVFVNLIQRFPGQEELYSDLLRFILKNHESSLLDFHRTAMTEAIKEISGKHMGLLETMGLFLGEGSAGEPFHLYEPDEGGRSELRAHFGTPAKIAPGNQRVFIDFEDLAENFSDAQIKEILFMASNPRSEMRINLYNFDPTHSLGKFFQKAKLNRIAFNGGGLENAAQQLEAFGGTVLHLSSEKSKFNAARLKRNLARVGIPENRIASLAQRGDRSGTLGVGSKDAQNGTLFKQLPEYLAFDSQGRIYVSDDSVSGSWQNLYDSKIAFSRSA